MSKVDKTSCSTTDSSIRFSNFHNIWVCMTKFVYDDNKQQQQGTRKKMLINLCVCIWNLWVCQKFSMTTRQIKTVAGSSSRRETTKGVHNYYHDHHLMCGVQNWLHVNFFLLLSMSVKINIKRMHCHAPKRFLHS